MNQFGKNLVIVLALVAAGFFAAYLRFRPYLGGGLYSDGAQTYDPGDSGPVRYAVWEAPETLPEPLNSTASESRPALSPDGRLLVFAAGERGLNQELFVAEIVDGVPGAPRPLTALNTAADECAPAFRGGALYFASDRGGGAGGLDLFRASYGEGTFGTVERLPGAIQSPADDCDPAPVPGSEAVVFASNRAGAGFDLYRAESRANGEAWDVARMDALDSAADEREPAFTADGRTLFFASDREHPRLEFDLYRSSLAAEGEWTRPAPLTGLNGPQSERAPLPAPDDFSLWFARETGASGLDLLRARSLELYRVPGRPVGWMELVALAALLVLALLAWLAKRWPGLDTLYKCYLVSVVAHLLLLWWFTGLFVEGGGQPLSRGKDQFRVKLLGSDARPIASLSERAGQLDALGADSDAAPAPLERRAPDSDALLASLEVRPQSDVGLAPVEAQAPAAPGRAEARFEAADAPRDVPLADRPTDLVRLAGAAPGLAIEASERASTPLERTLAGPERSGRSAQAGEADAAPGSALALNAPAAAQERAPARSGSGAAPASAPASTPGVALATPREQRAERGTSAEFAIDGLGAVSASDAAREPGQGPQRAAVHGADTLGEPAAPAAGAALADLAPRGGPAAPGAPVRAPTVAAPSGGAPSQVALRDREARPAPGERAGSGAPPTADLLDSLAGAEGKPAERAVEAGAPARWRRDDEPAPSAPTVAALAPPEDRRGEAPPAPRKSWEHTPYQNRSGEEKARALELHGGSQETEAAVANGLAYLARIQGRDGGWGDFATLDDKYGQVAVGKTGLALLAFLGAGHTHQSKTQYSDNVARALALLLSLQDEESGHFGESEAYSHGIATYAIAECFALTGEKELRAPLERAVAHILAKQNHERDRTLFGGWSYFYSDDRTYDRWPRSSITAWQVMALESARLSGLTVPDQAFTDAAAFLSNARDSKVDWVRYNHDPERLNSGWPTLPASTPAALFALSLVGEDINSPKYARNRAFVLERAPTEYRKGSDDEFVELGQGNLYFWYYGTLSMFRAGGDAWQRWNVAMKDTLLGGQQADGSWPAIDIYCRYARDSRRDLSYSTAMCVLSLEVYYRYYLPLLKVH